MEGFPTYIHSILFSPLFQAEWLTHNRVDKAKERWGLLNPYLLCLWGITEHNSSDAIWRWGGEGDVNSKGQLDSLKQGLNKSALKWNSFLASFAESFDYWAPTPPSSNHNKGNLLRLHHKKGSMLAQWECIRQWRNYTTASGECQHGLQTELWQRYKARSFPPEVLPKRGGTERKTISDKRSSKNVEKEYKIHMARNIEENVKNIFKYINSKKPVAVDIFIKEDDDLTTR